MQNKAILDITNKDTDTMIFKPVEMIGIIDLRVVRILQNQTGNTAPNLSRYYRFKKAEKLCEYFNKFVNTLRKEGEQKIIRRQYPWLDQDDER